MILNRDNQVLRIVIIANTNSQPAKHPVKLKGAWQAYIFWILPGW